jgi:hypothetical protein
MLHDRNGAGGWMDKGSDFAVLPYLSLLLMASLGGAKLAALGEKGVAGKVGQLAIRGAGSGALVGAGQEGVQAGFNPQQFDLKQSLENVGKDAAYGAVLNPLLHGTGSLLNQLNLKGQLAKMLAESNATKVDPEAFVKTLQDMKTPSGDVSNVLADSPKELPKPFEQKYNINPQDKPMPQNSSKVSKPVLLTTVKTEKPLQELSDTELEKVHQLLSDHEAVNLLTSKNPNRIHDINDDIAKIEKEMSDRNNGPTPGNDWFNFAQQGSNVPKARGLLPDITLPKRQSRNIQNIAEDTLNRGNRSIMPLQKALINAY